MLWIHDTFNDTNRRAKLEWRCSYEILLLLSDRFSTDPRLKNWRMANDSLWGLFSGFLGSDLHAWMWIRKNTLNTRIASAKSRNLEAYSGFANSHIRILLRRINKAQKHWRNFQKLKAKRNGTCSLTQE